VAELIGSDDNISEFHSRGALFQSAGTPAFVVGFLMVF
jgi:hypothetical protein